MAITVQYADPLAIAQASMQIGQGQYAQNREQQAMRERQMALEEAAFAEQQQQNDFRNEFAVQQFGADQYNRDRALRYGAYQDAQQMGLRQQALQQDAIGRQQQMAMQQADMAARQQQAREQQQMLAARDQMQIVSQVERDRQNQMAKMAAVEWDAIQKARADGRTFINDSHYQSAVQKWQDKYSALNQPMPIDLPFMEQPAIPESLSSFYGEYGIPFDEQTGEPLVSPQVQNQIIQARSQEKQAALKAQQEQQKLAIEEQKAQQEMERSALDQGFAQSNEQQQAAQQDLKKRESEDTKFVMGLISSYEKAEDKTGIAKPSVPEGARLNGTVAEYLHNMGYLAKGTRVYIDGNYVEVQ